jgi:diguanylate cyclase (GGDEF)-like protein
LINDSCGHPFGDTVLRRIAALAQSQCRQEDVLCRYGGEEFVILTPNVDGTGAARLAERIRSLIEAEQFQFNGNPVSVTCSFGVSEIQILNELPLLERADQALYDAKHGGRNQVRLCPGKSHRAPACT